MEEAISFLAKPFQEILKVIRREVPVRNAAEPRPSLKANLAFQGFGLLDQHDRDVVLDLVDQLTGITD